MSRHDLSELKYTVNNGLPTQFISQPMNVMFEPMGGYTTKNIARLLAQNRLAISPIYLPRLLYSLTLNAAFTPFRIKERRRYKQLIENTPLPQGPLHILGHWRSGTTFLHNLLSHDSSFGYCATLHTVVPELFLGSEKVIRPIVAASLPPTRPQDNVPLDADMPQEEEYGLQAITPYGYYNGWLFPRNMNFYYRSVTFKGYPQHVVDEIMQTYDYFLRKVSISNNGKRLLLKNPPSLARIKQILELYPESQFIHVIRNPYAMYVSMMRFIAITIPLYGFQKPYSMDYARDQMIELYSDMYDNYLAQRNLIPRENLYEVTFEELVKNPEKTVKEAYDRFGLHTYDNIKKPVHDYAKSQKNYKMNRPYELPEDIKNMLQTKWAHVFKAFDYDL